MSSNLVSYYSKLAGTTFDGRQDTIAKMRGTEELRFRREPENEHDDNAVAVDALLRKKWLPIGYIARDKNSQLAELILANKKASIQLKDITGGGLDKKGKKKNYGVNVYIEHEIISPLSAGAVEEVDLFGNKIFYDDNLHKYMNSQGEIYLSGSKYAEQFKKPFPKDHISNAMAKKAKLGAEGGRLIRDMWELKGQASMAWGTALHAALELYGRFKRLGEELGKDTHLHDNPSLREAVLSFYEMYPDVTNVWYEALVVDHKTKRAGRIDRLTRDKDGIYVEDFKTGLEVVPSLPYYWMQLSFYAAIIKANGREVKGLRIFHYDGTKWTVYIHDVIDIDKKEIKLLPETLMHPNIPKPLHEVNPRNIMGQEAWDLVRQEVYASTDYHCVACGVHKSKAEGHQWLEAHEYYDINYETGRVEIEKIIPLCHYCHNFIHSGRLSKIIGKEKTQAEAIKILEHGFKVLSKNKLKAFHFTVELANELRAKTYNVKPSPVQTSTIKWADWRLIWEGKEYPPKYKSQKEWSDRYDKT